MTTFYMRTRAYVSRICMCVCVHVCAHMRVHKDCCMCLCVNVYVSHRLFVRVCASGHPSYSKEVYLETSVYEKWSYPHAKHTKSSPVLRTGPPSRHGLATVSPRSVFGGANRVASKALWQPEVQISWQAQQFAAMPGLVQISWQAQHFRDQKVADSGAHNRTFGPSRNGWSWRCWGSQL